jgi:surface polysaccharide O-acyltransferase-like enzyme
MRIKSLDFIKGITILSVINMHVCTWSGTLDYYRGIAALWNVPVFFFIAGFLSTDKSDARKIKENVIWEP